MSDNEYNRDENAATNIREEGIRILSTNTAGHTGIQACGEDVRLVGKLLRSLACLF